MTSQEVVMKMKMGLSKRPKEAKEAKEQGADSIDTSDDESQRPAECLFCHATRIWWVGYHERTASVLKDGEVVHVVGIVARRARCATCRANWIVRLFELFPYRHFQLEIVAEAVARYLFDARATVLGVAVWARCAQRTLRRWVTWVGSVATPRDLVARLVEATGQPIRLNTPSVAAETRKGRTSARRSLFEAAAWNLALLEGLCSALALEPPGLKSVLSRIVGDRVGVTTYASPAIPELARSLDWCGSERLAM
jgi:hypothetical protein